MRQNKYRYLYVVQGYFDKRWGWEDVCQSENEREARHDLRLYRENESGYAHRLIRRRERLTR